MKATLTFIAIVFSLNCVAQTYPQSDFTEVPVPNFMSPGWYKLDTSVNKSFLVSIIDGKLQISQRRWLRSYSFEEFPVASGKLVLFHFFEFGGGLYYRPDDSTKAIYINGKQGVLNGNINSLYYSRVLKLDDEQFLAQLHNRNFLIKYSPCSMQAVTPYEDKWLFGEDWENMTGAHGGIYELKIGKDSINFSKIADINDRPSAIIPHKGKFFVAAENSFWCIDQGKVELLLSGLFWRMLGPTSLAVFDDETIYAGINGGYVKINIKTKEIKLYVYNKL